MRKRYTTSFKIQSVEKALSRDSHTSFAEVAQSLGISLPSLKTWIVKANNQEFEMASQADIDQVNNEKRPQDWTLDERLSMVIQCASLEDEALNTLCRVQGLYPHHVAQWKDSFINGTSLDTTPALPQVKTLRRENKALKQELNRKDKALAETAALLVLKKKAQAIWGSDEDR
jgi:transposase